MNAFLFKQSVPQLTGWGVFLLCPHICLDELGLFSKSTSVRSRRADKILQKAQEQLIHETI